MNGPEPPLVDYSMLQRTFPKADIGRPRSILEALTAAVRTLLPFVCSGRKHRIESRQPQMPYMQKYSILSSTVGSITKANYDILG